MTSSTPQLSEGWNPPKVTGERGLHVYVAKNGSETAYFKGRVNGKVTRIPLEGDTFAEWATECAALRHSGEKRDLAVTANSTTVGEYASTTFADRQRNRVGHIDPELRRSRRSVADDISRIEKFIAPSALGQMKWGDVRQKHVNQFILGLYQLRQEKNDKPYAPGTLGDIVRILGAIFREAKDDDLVTQNFVRDAKKPSRKPVTQKRYLTTEQIDALLAEISPAFYPIIMLCAWAGMRISEVLGLTWENFDLDAGTMTVEQQLDGESGQRVGLKTDNSNSTVGLLPEIVKTLRAHRKSMAERGLQYTRFDALVFVTLNGKPQGRRNALRALQNAADKLGLNTDEHGRAIKKVDLHSLRHSLISNGIDSGMTHAEMAHIARNDERTIVAVYSQVAEVKRGSVTTNKLAEKLGRTGTEA